MERLHIERYYNEIEINDDNINLFASFIIDNEFTEDYSEIGKSVSVIDSNYKNLDGIPCQYDKIIEETVLEVLSEDKFNEPSQWENPEFSKYVSILLKQKFNTETHSDILKKIEKIIEKSEKDIADRYLDVEYLDPELIEELTIEFFDNITVDEFEKLVELLNKDPYYSNFIDHSIIIQKLVEEDEPDTDTLLKIVDIAKNNYEFKKELEELSNYDKRLRKIMQG